MPEKYKQTEEKIRESLLNQLKAKKADIPVFLDLVEEYMELWKIARKLRLDISGRNGRGLLVQKPLSTGGYQIINNPSIKELTVVLKQKQAVLEKLKISPDEIMKLEAEEDELL